MSSAAPRAVRAGALLLLPCLGLALWLLRPGHPVTVAALLLCPGWGALRLMSVIDRRFGILGATLVLTVLVLGLATLAGTSMGLAPEQLGLAVQLGTLVLTLVGALRMARHRRWQAAQPPHPAPMALWPEHTAWCLATVALAAGAAVWASPPSRPAADSPALVQAASAEAWLRGGEDPLLAGVPQPATRVLAAAAAALSAGSGLHPVRAVQLLSLACLVATLVLCAESVARLRGNRGALAGLVAALLLLDPLGLVIDVLRPAGAPRIRPAIAPFLDGDGRVVTLASAALLLCATLSVLRRASFHTPRLAGVAALGLTLSAPAAAVLLLPGWLLGIALAHRACRDSPDNDPGTANRARRAGEPHRLRAPFVALAVPLIGGATGGLALAGWPAIARQPGLPALLALLVALGVGAPLYLPGVRWLNRGPGGEIWFFVGLLALAAPAAVLAAPAGESGADSAARLLALVLAVPTAIGVLKLLERPGRMLAVTLAALVLVASTSSAATVLRHAHAGHPLVAPLADGPCTVDPAWIAPDQAAALRELDARAPADAVLVPPADAPAALVALLAGRSLLVDPDAPAGRDDGRRALADALVAGDSSVLLPLRGRAGLAARELWTVHPPPTRPGFIEVARLESQALYRAPVPDIVLVTVAGLRAEQVGAAALPRSAERLARGLVFDEAFTPLPATLPALASLLQGTSPPEHLVLSDSGRVQGSAGSLPGALSRLGYRAIALVALENDAGLLAGFERAVRAPAAPAGELVDQAMSALAEADRRPLFVWLHLEDLPRSPAGRAVLDQALSRLLASVPEHSLFVLTSPWGRPRPSQAAEALDDVVVRVPLVVSGAGLPAARSGLLTALQDVPALLLRGVLPDRERVLLTVPAGPPAAGAPLLALRTPGTKTVLVQAAAPGEPPSGWTYDLGADPGEERPRAATAGELDAILAWQALAFR